MGSYQIEEVDVLLVGAGFASFTLLNRLRKLNFSVRIFEKGGASGGIWYWNCYPGARVDTDSPIYQLFDKELWQDFTFHERYPDQKEIKRYFDYVERKWHVRDHTSFHKNVESAVFDESRHQWLVECSDGSQIYARWFIPCIGFASKRYTPPFPGLGNFKGDIYHTALWPQYGVNLRGKRVAEVGTGASGTQVIQEIGDTCKELHVYMRTPNMCLPMNQRPLNEEEEQEKKKNGWYEAEMEKTRHTFAGFAYDFAQRNTFDDSPEEREKFYQDLFDKGGFNYWLATYKDMLYDLKANDEAYKFWRAQVLKRIKDPKKQELFAPEKPPHPWGTKRPSLEQRFYEVIDQPHVNVIDVNKTPIEEVTATGLRTKEGLVEVDAIILATGFDSVTGSLAQLDIRGTKGGTIADHWKNGTRTSMGIAMPEFPNMFFVYGPQAPTGFSSGPSCTQFQAEWVERMFKIIKERGITRLEATQESEDDWCRRLSEKWDATLFPMAKSWYQGANIPGRKVEPLNWAGGMVEYVTTLNGSLENDLQGWKYIDVQSTMSGLGTGSAGVLADQSGRSTPSTAAISPLTTV